MFITEDSLSRGTWQAFERAVCRLLLYDGFDDVHLVGQTADKGADILANKFGKRWLFQVKHWRSKVGLDVIDRTLDAMQTYRAKIPVIVALSGFEESVYISQQTLLNRQIPLQLWDRLKMLEMSRAISPNFSLSPRLPRPYQELPINRLVSTYLDGEKNHALIVMATGLGKTYTAAEAIRRIDAIKRIKVLVIAHANPLVYQLEKAFWPMLRAEQETIVWNGYERPDMAALERSRFTFACVDSLASHVESQFDFPDFDMVVIDECHHVGGQMYEKVITKLTENSASRPFLLGLTATPWRPDEVDLTKYFGKPLVSIDMVTGLKSGFLSNIDYRMYTDNIDWNGLRNLKGKSFTPKQINRNLFITEWDDAVVKEIRKIWGEQPTPRAIVFCGTIDHAITMRDRINSLGFCNAQAIYSQSLFGVSMPAHERNRIMSDFHDGTVDVVCAVDIFNEGVDVPDVNIIVFQRVTHSRRIFIQQLGRGLRVTQGKSKVIVLDFVSDIRRFAAGLDLKDGLNDDGVGPAPGKSVRIQLANKVTFRRADGEDKEGETFLRQWLDDVAAIEEAGEDSSVLRFPPQMPGGR